jgi:hypothetical protein
MKTKIDMDDLSLSPEFIEAWKKGEVGTHKQAPESKIGIKFYPFPDALVRTLIRTNYMPALALAAAIYKAYFKDWGNRNPVKLTSAHLAEFHISRYQKLRALKILEQSGLFLVERFKGRNPLITMTWLRIQKD